LENESDEEGEREQEGRGEPESVVAFFSPHRGDNITKFCTTVSLIEWYTLT